MTELSAETLRKLRRLHRPVRYSPDAGTGAVLYCVTCHRGPPFQGYDRWPCRTARLLKIDQRRKVTQL